MKRLLIGCGGVLLATLPVHADEGSSPFRDTYGEVGLLETPSALMADDGQLSFTAGAFKNTTRFALGFQILPWLDGSFRYSAIQHFNAHATDYDRSFGLKARLYEETANIPEISVGVRDIVGTGIYGAEYLVATKRVDDFEISGGLGWGRLAGNEMFDNPFGWIISSFNKRPIGRGSTVGQIDAGLLFHGPDTGLFGGVRWNTPIKDLSLVVEYSSDAYPRERLDRSFSPRMPVNVGVSYRPVSFLTLTAGWLYGTSWGLIASLSTDPTADASPRKLDAPPIPPETRAVIERQEAVAMFVSQHGNAATRTLPPSGNPMLISNVINSAAAVRDVEIDGNTLAVYVQRGAATMDACERYARIAGNSGLTSVAVSDADRASAQVRVCTIGHSTASTPYSVLQTMEADTAPASPSAEPVVTAGIAENPETKIREAASAQSLGIEAIKLGAGEMSVFYTNATYNLEANAIGRMSRVLLANAPAGIELFRLIAMNGGVAQQEVDIVRAPFENILLHSKGAVDLGDAVSLSPPPLNAIDGADELTSYPRFDWSLSPGVRQSLFDPEKPIEFQVLAALTASVQLLPGLSLSTRVEGNIYNDFSFSFINDSQIAHVRTDFPEYLKHGINGISDLIAAYDARIAPDVFVEAKAGYLEDMFAGAGIQALWRPSGERWAMGFDLYDVKQRAFDRLFGFRSYQTVTGHANVYYESPWHGLNFAVHAGRYLAGDYGATLEISRRFLTDIDVGIFATFTNVPFAKFGEGSFDKGILIHIPLEWGLPFASQTSYDLDLRPLTRDGGQRLDGDDSLFGETQRTSYGEIASHAQNIGNP